jgi:hypothetical protein
MEWVYYLLKSAFVLLGIITILVGKYLSVKIIMPKRAKYKVIDEENYVKSRRMMFYCLGFYYILFGIVLLFKNGWPGVVGLLGTMIPALIVVVSSPNRRKYIEPINEFRNKI